MYKIQHTETELELCKLYVQVVLGNEYSANVLDGISLVVKHNGTPIQDMLNYKKLKDAENSVVVEFSGKYTVVRAKRVQDLLDLEEEPHDAYINSDEDFNNLSKLFITQDLEQLSKWYNELTGCEVIDHRDSYESEFTNVNAQRDPDFWDEESITK